MHKIYKYTFGYGLIRKYILFAFRRFYGELIIRGVENLPVDGSALIFAPNHLNALMDALAVSLLMPPRRVVVYLARADLFKRKIVARLLHFAKIAPAFRMRDGFAHLGKNKRSFDSCIEALQFGHAVCIMPEGGQGEEHRIRPLTKGIFRVGCVAQQVLGSKRKVKIVPVGIDMGHLIKTGKHLIINIGTPIDIQTYTNEYPDNLPTAINAMRDELHKRLSGLTLDLATETHYSAFSTITEILAGEYSDVGEKSDIVLGLFQTKQHTAKLLCEIEKTSPDVMRNLDDMSTKYNSLLKQLRFESPVFSRLPSEQITPQRLLLLSVTFPGFLFGLLTNALPLFVPVWIRRALNVAYSGFFSSIHFGLGLITFPLFYSIQAVVFHLLFSPGIGATAIFALLQVFTKNFSLKWHSNFVKYRHKRRFNRLLTARSEQSNLLHELIRLREDIISEVSRRG